MDVTFIATLKKYDTEEWWIWWMKDFLDGTGAYPEVLHSGLIEHPAVKCDYLCFRFHDIQQVSYIKWLSHVKLYWYKVWYLWIFYHGKWANTITDFLWAEDSQVKSVLGACVKLKKNKKKHTSQLLRTIRLIFNIF